MHDRRPASERSPFVQHGERPSQPTVVRRVRPGRYVLNRPVTIMINPALAVTIPIQLIAPLLVVKPKTTLAPMIPAPAAASVSPACFSPLGAIGISFPKPPAPWWTTASGA